MATELVTIASASPRAGFTRVKVSAAQGHRIGDLPCLAAPRDGLKNPPVHRIGEMLVREKLRNPLIGLVVGEQRAEQSLLGLGIAGRQPLGEAQQRSVDGIHDLHHSLNR